MMVDSGADNPNPRIVEAVEERLQERWLNKCIVVEQQYVARSFFERPLDTRIIPASKAPVF
jgi:hypothetical protein